MALYSLKVYGTQNTGGPACNPLDYYSHPYTPLNIIVNPRPRLAAKDTVVIGGGGLLAHSPAWDYTDPGALTRSRSLNDHFHTLIGHLL